MGNGFTSQEQHFIVSRRGRYLGAALFVLVLGWSARSYSTALPSFAGAYLPDVLWALMVLLLVSATRPRWPLSHRVIAAFGFAYAIEFSQLYQADWSNAVRRKRWGGLILGHGFLWSDLLCYTAGIGMGALLMRAVLPADKTVET